MRMMADIQKLREMLPGIDCGSCGAPNCRAFAEDVVRKTANKNDCIIMMRPEIKKYLEAKEEENDG